MHLLCSATSHPLGVVLLARFVGLAFATLAHPGKVTLFATLVTHGFPETTGRQCVPCITAAVNDV